MFIFIILFSRLFAVTSNSIVFTSATKLPPQNRPLSQFIIFPLSFPSCATLHNDQKFFGCPQEEVFATSSDLKTRIFSEVQFSPSASTT